MFIKTTAVGPLEPVASCVTGGTGVARDLIWFALPRRHSEVVGVLVCLNTVACDALLVSCVTGRLKAIAAECPKNWTEEMCYDLKNITEALRK